MDPLNLLKTLFKSGPAIQPGTSIQPDLTALKPGQIISGKILKLYPNDFADVLVGSEKLLAKLEVTLSTNQQYWFKVLVVDGKITLKMIKTNSPEWLQAVNQDAASQTTDQVLPFAGQIGQWVTQIPLQLGNHQTELTIQWNGKKQPDGKIDPDDCRILFYLELANLGETLVDIQIQKRTLLISVINGTTGLKSLAAPLLVPLKKRLGQWNYQLKAVKFEEPKQRPLKSQIKMNTLVKAAPAYQEVDIRI